MAGDAYQAFLRRASAARDVVGLVLMGSRAAGTFVTERSDHDLIVVVDGEPGPWRTAHGSPVETWPMTIGAFRAHGLREDSDAWNRPAFLDARVVLDRLDGEIGRLAEAKRRLSSAEATSIGAHELDGYVNSLYRSLRNLEAGRELEGRLDGLESIGPLLSAVFAFEGRVRPFNKWLRHELDVRPLSFEGLVELVDGLAADPSAERQREAFRRIEAAARQTGHAAVIDGWEPDVAWLRGPD